MIGACAQKDRASRGEGRVNLCGRRAREQDEGGQTLALFRENLTFNLLMCGLRLPLPPDPYVALLPALATYLREELDRRDRRRGDWTYYATDRMQDRHSALGAALLTVVTAAMVVVE